MLQECRYFFVDEILGLPVEREIDFTIDLVPGEAPLYKTPYKMRTPKLLQMKM